MVLVVSFINLICLCVCILPAFPTVCLVVCTHTHIGFLSLFFLLLCWSVYSLCLKIASRNSFYITFTSFTFLLFYFVLFVGLLVGWLVDIGSLLLRISFPLFSISLFYLTALSLLHSLFLFFSFLFIYLSLSFSCFQQYLSSLKDGEEEEEEEGTNGMKGKWETGESNRFCSNVSLINNSLTPVLKQTNNN